MFKSTITEKLLLLVGVLKLLFLYNVYPYLVSWYALIFGCAHTRQENRETILTLGYNRARAKRGFQS